MKLIQSFDLKKKLEFIAILFFVIALSSGNWLFAKRVKPPKVQGIVTCTISIPGATGAVTFSLLTITGEKMYERKVSLQGSDRVQRAILLGAQPRNSYIVEAEGELQILMLDGTILDKSYSRACKVTTDDQGNALAQFGDQ